VKDILSYLYALRNRGSSFGIERMARLVELMGNPQSNFPIIHVAGTNGKGSVCAMLDAIYRENGYRVGLFTSPHLVELGERIRVNGQNISEAEIEEWVDFLKPLGKKIEKEKKDDHPTFFEFMTAIAFLKFKKNNVDLAIIETGLGGRLDSTNVVKPELSIITSISMDHCAILGDTLEEIAAEKAGIIKKETPVLVSKLEQEAEEVIRSVAEKKNANFYSLNNLGMKKLPYTNLSGSYQKRNAALALHATELLREKIPVDGDLVKKGLQNVRIEGRWQILKGEPKIILDACHNLEGANCLRENLKSLEVKPEVWFGVLGEDRARDIIGVVCEFASSIRLFQVEQPRACSIDFLRSLIPHSFTGEVIDFDMKKAQEAMLASTPGKTILVTGSIYLIGDILSLRRSGDFPSKVNWNDLF
jgi:dihydrofolate synthase/folylpolyglutamate synthase